MMNRDRNVTWRRKEDWNMNKKRSSTKTNTVPMDKAEGNNEWVPGNTYGTKIHIVCNLGS
jgi:hypothetical protein